MYFKKLEMYGFKSFVDKTELEFSPGIIAIVGPNGCGKTNICDAVRWALGEQSAKSLRGSRMEDIIFNGTENRKSLGMAEVSLTMADLRNVLAVDYEELVVTRRVFRSGESEYLINKFPVRLKDIDETFMDTGIGTNAYSVLEQGKMDIVLSSKSVDRRYLFEEAAGISKYKAKKDEALHKLELTEQNLIRLSDIIAEVKRQIGSLERQAKKAEKYKVLKDELKEIEVQVSLHEHNNFKKLIHEIEKEEKGLIDKQISCESSIRQEDAKLEELKLKSIEKDKELLKLRLESNEFDKSINKCEHEIIMRKERKANLIEFRGKLLDDVGKITGKLSEVNQKKDESKRNLDDTVLKIAKEKDELKNKEIKVTGLTSEIKTIEEELSNFREITNNAISSEIKKILPVLKDVLITSIENIKAESLVEAMGLVEKKLQSLKNLLEEFLGISESRESRIKELETNLLNNRKLKEELMNDIGKLKTSLASIEMRKINLESEIDRFVKLDEEFKSEVEKNKSEIEIAKSSENEFEEDMNKFNVSMDELFKTKEKIEKNIAEFENNRALLRDELFKYGSEIHKLREENSVYQKKLHENELSKAKYEMEIRNIHDLILREYNIDISASEAKIDEFKDYASARPEASAESCTSEESKKKVSELREKLNEIGSVNMVAMEEYEELTKRHEFLTKQEKDLVDAKESLHRVINNINQTTKTLFSDAFTKIKENFREIFRQLFGGGDAELVLVDEGNLLETGVDIIARPPGKRLQSIGLLSGGERALTAIALLFALFRLKPSPFCILDEIDAPLDDVNIKRFTNMLKEFSKNTQFIVITHSKITMEAADALYGATMEEPGVSRIISVKLES